LVLKITDAVSSKSISRSSLSSLFQVQGREIAGPVKRNQRLIILFLIALNDIGYNIGFEIETDIEKIIDIGYDIGGRSKMTLFATQISQIVFFEIRYRRKIIKFNSLFRLEIDFDTLTSIFPRYRVRYQVQYHDIRISKLKATMSYAILVQYLDIKIYPMLVQYPDISQAALPA
jgi:hypothetical protein